MATLPGPAPAPPVRGPTGGILLLTGAAAAVVSFFLPWWRLGLESATAIGFDISTPIRGGARWPGWVLLLAALAMGATGILTLAGPGVDRHLTGVAGIGAAVTAMIAVVVALAARRAIVGASLLEVRVGAGLVVAAAGAVVAGIGGAWLIREGTASPPPPRPTFT
jgi:hypothetical protein